MGGGEWSDNWVERRRGRVSNQSTLVISQLAAAETKLSIWHGSRSRSVSTSHWSGLIFQIKYKYPQITHNTVDIRVWEEYSMFRFLQCALAFKECFLKSLIRYFTFNYRHTIDEFNHAGKIFSPLSPSFLFLHLFSWPLNGNLFTIAAFTKLTIWLNYQFFIFLFLPSTGWVAAVQVVNPSEN